MLSLWRVGLEFGRAIIVNPIIENPNGGSWSKCESSQRGTILISALQWPPVQSAASHWLARPQSGPALARKTTINTRLAPTLNTCGGFIFSNGRPAPFVRRMVHLGPFERLSGRGTRFGDLSSVGQSEYIDTTSGYKDCMAKSGAGDLLATNLGIHMYVNMIKYVINTTHNIFTIFMYSFTFCSPKTKE